MTPGDLHNTLVRLAAQQLAVAEVPGPWSAGPANVHCLTWSEIPTVAFALHDVHGEHPIMHLT